MARPSMPKRLSLADIGGRNEAWLRDLLFANPDLLPISDIDPSFGPFCPFVVSFAQRLDLSTSPSSAPMGG